MTAHALLASNSVPPYIKTFKFMHRCSSSRSWFCKTGVQRHSFQGNRSFQEAGVWTVLNIQGRHCNCVLPGRRCPAHSPCCHHCKHVQYQHQLLSSYHPDRCMLLLQCFGCHSIVARPSCHVPEFASDGMDIRDVQKLLIVSTTSFTIACIQSTRHWQRSRHILAHRPKIPQSIISNAKTCNKMNVQFQVTVSCKPAAPLTL